MKRAQVGAGFAFERGIDFLLPYYRDLALSLVFGLSATDVMMAALARAPDPTSGGRADARTLRFARRNIITSSSPVATQIPHASGIAYAAEDAEDGRGCHCLLRRRRFLKRRLPRVVQLRRRSTSCR